MSTPFVPNDPNVRLSDAERSAAMERLSDAFATGRLSLTEYDERCKVVASSTYTRELNPVFGDLPSTHGQPDQVPVLYTPQQVAKAHQQSRYIRAGLLSLSVIAAIPLSTIVHPLLWIVVPTMWVLLYLMKVGPSSWYTPSPRQVERERMRELRIQTAEQTYQIKAKNEVTRAQLRARRREAADQLTNEALDFARRSIKKLNN